jgi:hypothetical protein
MLIPLSPHRDRNGDCSPLLVPWKSCYAILAIAKAKLSFAEQEGGSR